MTTAREALARQGWYAALDGAHQQQIVARARDVHFDAGVLIARAGTDAEVFYVIEDGRVALELDAPGRGLVVETLARGDIVGISWLLPPHRWQFDVVAIDPVRAIEFDAAALRAEAASDDALALGLTRCVAELTADRLHATRVRLLDIYGAPVEHGAR